MLTLFIVALAVAGTAYGLGNRAPSADYEGLADFDVDRYLGRWYEIARYDHRFERGLDYVTAEYVDEGNGRLKVINRGYDRSKGRLHETVGKAKLTTVPGHLRVSFFLFFYSDYNILALGDNYEWVLIGSRSPKYLWILSRTPTLPATRLQAIMAIAERHGYDTDRLIFVDQMPPSESDEGFGIPTRLREKEHAR